jgi:hypothetical protein
MSLPGGGLDPSKIPTGLEGKQWKGGNRQSWVSDHAGLIFVTVAATGIIGIVIAFIVSAIMGDDSVNR